MAYLHDASPTAPMDDLVIPPADGRVLRPGDGDFEKLLPFNRRTLVRPLCGHGRVVKSPNWNS